MTISVLRLAKRYARAVLYLPLRTLLLFQPKRGSDAPTPRRTPRRILLINGAHIGDVVIASSLLPVLHSAFPGVEIGIACGSWAREVLREHPQVSFTHEIDHWRLNRAAIGLAGKVHQYWITRRSALREMRALNYDLAISLHPSRPDFVELTWQAGIPTRAAFTQSLWAPLATVLAAYPADDAAFVTQGACLEPLLRALGIDEKHIRLRRPSLPPTSPQAMAEVSALFGGAQLDQTSYSVVHIGSGVPAKELSTSFWRELSVGLSERGVDGHCVLFSGAGQREQARILEVMEGVPCSVDACDKLSWSGFVAAVRHAEALYGVDSAAAHVAAAVGTPCFAVYSGIGGVGRWRPEGDGVIVWNQPVPCSPCHRKNGCREMSCMKGIAPQDLLQVFPEGSSCAFYDR
jgi:ADP-heptose:LPS heptosyltransferase